MRPCVSLSSQLGRFLSHGVHRSISKHASQSSLGEYFAQFFDVTVTKDHPKVEEISNGLLDGRRASLARAITLVESRHPTQRAIGERVLSNAMKACGERGKPPVFRIGISGSPGVGKSSFIETFGLALVEKHKKRVAVLTVDPSSATTGGSIMGDVTRMTELSRTEMAYIRSSPTRGVLGGVTGGTREAMLLCETAGFEVVLVETVGVGQSETAVASMVDMFVVLLSPVQGDELQGMKRGIIELCDLILVTKSDGALVPQARNTQAEYLSALKFMRQRRPEWKPEVHRCSAHTGEGIDEAWARMCDYFTAMDNAGRLAAMRQEQLQSWMWDHIDYQLPIMFKRHPLVLEMASEYVTRMTAAQISPGLAAQKILRKFMETK